MTEPKDVVIFSIGPIQSYITAARRTQDLRTASQILSILALAACEESVRSGCELVYPQLRSGGEGVPNRIVFLAPAHRGPDIADAVKKCVDKKRDDLSQIVETYFRSKLSGATYDSDLWKSQVDDWLEFYWISLTWDGGEETYHDSLRKASLGLDGRKSIRWYPGTIEKRETCTMCGARSTLGGKDFWNKLKFSSRLIRDQERLCAVCTIKRLLPHAPGSPISSAHFPSTASIASSSYRDEIKKYWYVEEVQTAFKHLVQTLEALKLELPPPDEPRARLERIEGAYFYNDFYQLDQLKRETGESPTANQLILAKKRLETLNELLKQHKAAFPEPNSYYAVLMIDGDHMGKRLDSIQNRENHQEFSQVLAELAVQANSIVQQLRGRIIYSGGDDVLALFPVDSVLTAANELQSNFNQKLEAAGFSGMHMSAGISVAHNSQPLQLVIAAAREAESEAKSACGRNALVINVAKRSGEPRKAGLKWNSPGGTPAPLDTIRLFVEAIAGDQLSGKLSYELWEELPALADSPDNPSSAWFTKELYRLLKRHRINEEWKSDQELQDWADALSNLWDFMPFPQSSKIEQITQWLLIARFLAKGEQI